jgi:hypothetical protein
MRGYQHLMLKLQLWRSCWYKWDGNLEGRVGKNLEGSVMCYFQDTTQELAWRNWSKNLKLSTCLSTTTYGIEVMFCTFQTYTLPRGFKAMAKWCQSSQHHCMDIISYKWGQLGELTSHKFHDKRIHNAVKNLHQLAQHHLTYKNT